MQLEHLKYFVEIVKSGSITSAAQTLHIAQPALSRVIKNLETELGAPLLIRSQKGVLPTPLGQKICEDFLRFHQDMLTWYSFSDVDNFKGTISLQMPSALVNFFANNITIAFCQKYPNIRINHISSRLANMYDNLKKGVSNIAITSTPLSQKEKVISLYKSPGWELKELFVDERRVIISTHNPLAAKESLSLNDLKLLKLVDYPKVTDPIRIIFHSFFKETLVMPDLNSIISTVIDHQSAAIINWHITKNNYYITNNLIKSYPLPDIPQTDYQVAYYAIATSNANRAEMALYEYISTHFNDFIEKSK